MTFVSRSRVLAVTSALVMPGLVAALASVQAPVRVGGNIKEPKLLSRADPEYPAIARQAQVEGMVVIEATIDQSGNVRDVRVLRGHALFNDAAMAAVRQWKYEPTLLNGVPVDVLMTVVVNFTLKDAPKTDVNALLDQAKAARDTGRFAEAEQLLQRALDQVRAERLRQEPALAGSPNVAPAGPVRVGGAVLEPRRIKWVPPTYPAEAISAKIEGQAIVEATIGLDGKVKGARVLRALPVFEQAALDAVRQWIYEPATLNGVPVEVLMTVVVNFTLK